jgi:NitT/TauT family transport system permease protein
VKFILTRILPPLLALLLIGGAWELIVDHWRIPIFELPAPSAVYRGFKADRTELFGALWITAEATLIGFAASTIVGVTLAIILSASKWLRRAFYPYTIFFQTVPIVAIAPLLVIWLDPGLQSVATAAFIVSVFPVIANTLSGLLSTDPALEDLFRLHRAGIFARYWKLRLPSALPSIFTGLRIAAGLSVIGVIVSEVMVGEYGSSEGLGVKLLADNHNGRTDLVFAAVLLSSLLGLVLFSAVNLAGMLLLRRWHASER